MRLVLVGTSHHHAPVELRERVALDREHAEALAAQLGEAVVLSTCNRTELYVVAEDGDEAEHRAVGVARLVSNGDSVDALVVATAVTWLVWAAYLVLRATRGLAGRRAAYLALAGFVLVIVVRLALPATHFA